MPNFKWARHLAVTRGHIALTLEQIGETMLARRYHLGLDQEDIAERSNTPDGDISQTDISNIEKGVVPAHLRGDHDRLRKILDALEFPQNDAQIYVDLLVSLDVRLREME